MAPTAKAAEQRRRARSVLGSVKSTLLNAKNQFKALRVQGKPKVTKPTSTSTPKPRLNERDRLKRVLEDLAFTERCYCENDVDLEPVTEELEGTEDADDLGVLDERHQGDSPEQAPTEERHKSDAAGADEHSLRMQPPRTDLRISQFEIGKPLGRGMFGQVYLARHRTSNFICALKVISKAACASDGAEKLVLRELEVHQNMRHANILRFYAWFHNKISIYLILEYAPNGDLYSKLKTQPHGRFKEPDAARYITQMAEALRYMHRKNVIYRDIKPENILLGFRNEIKLADFGWSVHSESGFRSTVCGTLDYLSPEVAVMMLKPGQTDQWYTNAIDKWSLGVLTFEMLVGKPPFETKSIKTTEKKIANFDGCIKFPKYVSREAEDFVLQLLILEAEKRMSLDEVLEHPWIKQNVDKAESGVRKFSRLLDKAAKA